jgi:hypothetical protein
VGQPRLGALRAEQAAARSGGWIMADFRLDVLCRAGPLRSLRPQADAAATPTASSLPELEWGIGECPGFPAIIDRMGLAGEALGEVGGRGGGTE